MPLRKTVKSAAKPPENINEVSPSKKRKIAKNSTVKNDDNAERIKSSRDLKNKSVKNSETKEIAVKPKEKKTKRKHDKLDSARNDAEVQIPNITDTDNKLAETNKVEEEIPAKRTRTKLSIKHVETKNGTKNKSAKKSKPITKKQEEKSDENLELLKSNNIVKDTNDKSTQKIGKKEQSTLTKKKISVQAEAIESNKEQFLNDNNSAVTGRRTRNKVVTTAKNNHEKLENIAILEQNTKTSNNKQTTKTINDKPEINENEPLAKVSVRNKQKNKKGTSAIVKEQNGTNRRKLSAQKQEKKSVGNTELSESNNIVKDTKIRTTRKGRKKQTEKEKEENTVIIENSTKTSNEQEAKTTNNEPDINENEKLAKVSVRNKQKNKKETSTAVKGQNGTKKRKSPAEEEERKSAESAELSESNNIIKDTKIRNTRKGRRKVIETGKIENNAAMSDEQQSMNSVEQEIKSIEEDLALTVTNRNKQKNKKAAVTVNQQDRNIEEKKTEVDSNGNKEKHALNVTITVSDKRDSGIQESEDEMNVPFDPMKPRHQLSRTPENEQRKKSLVRRDSDIFLPLPVMQASEEFQEQLPPPEDFEQCQVNWEQHKAQLVPCRKCKRKYFPHRIKKHEACCKKS